MALNSTKTLLDVGIRELALGGAVYQIDSVAASGGLSIVYKAHKRGVNEASVLVKEYWPHEAGAERAEDGSLALPDGTATHQALAYRESDAAQELRKATRDGYADDWFQKYSEPFKANGTVYTVIEAVSGTMLSELIDQKTFGLSAACEQVLRVAEALEHIHRKGFLHLDIKPENIHVSDMEVGHKRVARLIDYNTAWKIGEAPPEIRTTLKGYSAPELLAKRDLLFATDIYSLAALLFCLLAGRAPTGEDIRLLSCETWDLAPLAGMGADAVNSVKMFLSENLASMPCKRNQSLADVSNRLKDIISMAKKPALFNTPHFEQTFAFAGREREFAEIDRLLEQSNWLVVCGLPGIGKTELVRAYANSRYGQLFDYMQLVSFAGSLMETTLKLKLRNFDAGNLVFEEMIGVLSDLGRRSLVIVDGYDVLDDLDFTALVSNECRFLFTSDVVHDELGAYELKAIDDGEALMEIFARAYGAGSSEKLSGLSGIREMLKCVNGHAMLVSLMAKTMRRSGKSADEMLELLRKSENTGMPEAALRMLGIESQQERDIYDKFYALFRIGGVEADPLSAQVMANLSLLPLDGVDLKRFQEWTGLGDMPVVERLASLGWVNQESVSLHKIVSGIAFAMLAPDSVKCSSLVEGITRLDEPGEAINIMRFACGRVTDPTQATAGMLRAFVSLLSARQSIHGGELAFLSELFSDSGTIEIEQVASYFRIALHEGSETWLDHAQAFMLKLESQGRIPRGASNPVAWRLRAMYWQERGDQEKAYECLELAKRRNPETAMASCEKGFLALKDWNPEEALKHFDASIAFCNECFEPIPGFYAHLLAGKGRALAMKGYAKEAWPILAEAAKAQEALFGGSREETANTCELLAKTLLSLDNSKDAEAFAGKAATIYEYALGTRNEKTVQARAFLGELRNRNKDRAGKASATKALRGSADLEKRVLS
ncbi:MAG: protein kinase, partial [Clostridiales bacterium]|nr:protein kinase [Clostridiales bacterium]